MSERIRTFDLFERVADGPRRRYTPPPSCCPSCSGIDREGGAPTCLASTRNGWAERSKLGHHHREHERWCPQSRGVQTGAHHIGSVHEAAPGEARCDR